MKSLTSFGALIRGAMIGLSLNLSLLPMVQAQQASPPRPIEPAVIVPIDPPIVIPVDPQPVDPFDAAEALQRDIYNRLFGGGFETYEFAYELASHVASTGTYHGFNDRGAPFELNVVVAQELPLELVAMNAADVARIAGHEMRATAVMASVTGPAAVIACMAIVMTQTDGAAPAQHRMLILNELPYVPGLFEGYPTTLAGTQPSPDPGSPWEVDPPDGPSDPRTLCDQCYQDASDDARAAQMRYDRIEAEAREARDAAIAAADAALRATRTAELNALGAAILTLSAAYAAAIVMCAQFLALPAAGQIWAIACAATATIAVAAAIAAAYSIAMSRIAAAEAANRAAVSAAHAAYAARVGPAYDELTEVLLEVAGRLVACLNEHQCLK